MEPEEITPGTEPVPSENNASDRALLHALAARVAELEREVATLRVAQKSASAGQARPFKPLPPVLAQMAGTLPATTPQQVPGMANFSQAAPPPPAVARSQSIESRLGSQVFNRVGIVALLIAASWGLKLAFENQWVGPAGRIVIGLLAGAGLVLWSERFRRKGFGPFSYSLKAVGSGVLYLSLWAAFRVYHLLPAAVALGLMILVTAWNAYMAWSQDSELLGAYALSGALATPVLLSTGGNHEVFLFCYLGVIDVATLLLVRAKPWPRLLLSALVGTVSFYAGWYLKFYDFGFVSGADAPPFGVTSAFLLMFGAMFALGSVRGFVRWGESLAGGTDGVPAKLRLRRSPAILSVLVPFLNAGFLALAFSLLVRSHFQADLLPWLMVVFALVYLLLMRVQRTVAAAAIHLALAVIFLTVAIPLKASGHALIVAWFAEGITLLWASTRVGAQAAGAPAGQPKSGLSSSGLSSSGLSSSGLSPARVLRALSVAGYVLGSGALFVRRFVLDVGDRKPFLTAELSSALVAALAFGLAAYLLLRPRASASGAGMSGDQTLAMLAVLGLDAVAVLLASRELGSVGIGNSLAGFANADFGKALVGLGVLAASAWLCLRLPAPEHRGAFERLAAGTFMLFNLVAILSVVTEIDGLWTRSEANLQRSLAVSGFLMIYGAALLALGFVKRSAFTRWQALVLIVFTIAKVFLYDMSSLSQGYRVLSFLGLGVLLMAVSFAYQKDWLGLKEPAPAAADRGGL